MREVAVHKLLIVPKLPNAILDIPHIVHSPFFLLVSNSGQQSMAIHVLASPADGVDLVVADSTDFELFLGLFGRVGGVFVDGGFGGTNFVF